MIDLERRILKALTEHQRLAMDFAHSYNHKIFSTPENRVISKHFIAYIKNFRSKPTKYAILENIKEDDGLIQLFEAFWDETNDFNYDDANYNFDVEQLKERHLKSLLEDLKSNLINGSEDEDTKEKIKGLERSLSEIKGVNQKKTFSRATLREFVPEFKQNYKAKFNNPDLGCGLKTGYSFLDFVTNGLHSADLMLICAETGSGKSIWLNNIAINMWLQKNTVDTAPNDYSQGANVMYFSLEMPQESCFRRTVSALGDIPAYGIRDTKLNQYEAKTLAKCLKFMDNYPYEFDIIDVPRGFSVDEMELHFEEAKSRYHPDAIFIDYLGLMEDVGGGDDQQDWLKLGQLTGKVHEFARAHQIPIISAVQLNRLERGKKVNPVGLHRIGRSALIAHHASVVVQIETRENENAMPDFVYHIIKNRDGELGYHTIDKNFACTRVIDKPYDTSNRVNYLASSEDISDEMARIIGNILE